MSFANCRSSERDAPKDMIASIQIKQVERPVFVMDRGYPSDHIGVKEDGHRDVGSTVYR